ncbi:hypothetical protein C8A00DRAFT_14664 [Chaetomidium leptoderma]|uniref:Nucleoside phosphorylase domain-containing protein n=1 Tax=Chaetomidium leptoderma TaxID=669021 RepID=A0AAN6VPU7_9PEZI|nr:hypothetical protein C8A00DRAFT_14664 [Chaetomidium leptoderma]
MSDPNLYTVGWICAITTEYVAAQSLLDEEHDGPEFVSTHDNNDYALGTMGRHNVVIAVLPDGEYGTASAATVARDMLHSFPNVRIGLMVGIGGGAPSAKHDIRLGDIVVSSPGDGEGGVFQYDFGKAVQDQKFQVTGRLNQPPTVVRTAVSGLKTQYMRKGHKLLETINDIIAGNKRLKATHAPPDPKLDILYQSAFVHSDPKRDCSAICHIAHGCPRTPRIAEQDNPAIHYGLIASANQVMKDATARDRLIAEKDVLCFEMEAAGLMNHFPCLVVRGICDYSDSHKNKVWQGYAAMTAAAYTKDLLARIAPNRIEAERKIKDVMSGVEKDVKALGSRLDQQDDGAILDWIAPGDRYGCLQSDHLGRRQPGTGQWLLTSAPFRTWLAAKRQTLFCVGIPGAGKTILTSVVTQHLLTRCPDKSEAAGAVGVAFVYCDLLLKLEQRAEDLLSSLLKQLSQGLHPLPDCVKTLYRAHENGRTRPSLADVSKCLQDVAGRYASTSVVVDALDEYRPHGSHSSNNTLVTELFALQERCGTNLFVTSRPVPEIEDQFAGPGVVSLEIRADKADIERYLDDNMSQLPKCVSRDPKLLKAIKEAIAAAVCGMFLLATLYLEALSKKHTVADVKSALKKLSTGPDVCDSAYEDIMERRIEEKEFALRALSWIVFAKRPLTTIELRHALAARSEDMELDVENLPEIEDIVSCCAGLVTVDRDSDMIRLVHQSAYEYFRRPATQKRWFSEAEDRIATVCATYLSFDAFNEGPCPSDKAFEARIQSHPLYSYAARNWGYHVSEASVLNPQVRKFLGSGSKLEASSQAMMASNDYVPWPEYSQNVPRQMTGLHLLACFGALNAVKELIAQLDGADLRDSYERTPLSWAAAFDRPDVVELLLRSGKANPNWQDKDGRTILSLAAEHGSVAVVRLLLQDERVDASKKDKNGWAPLTWAARNGCEDTVRLLLAKAELKGGAESHAPLLAAVQHHHTTVAELILSFPGTDENWKAEGLGKVALWASADGQVDTLNLLVVPSHPDMANTKDTINGLTPLMKAVQYGHEDTVRWMLDRATTDPNQKDKAGRTGLLLAAENSQEAIFRLLFAPPKVDVDCVDNQGQTPLLTAARHGATEIVRFLLESGKINDADRRDVHGQTPLFWAARGGHDAITTLLLDSAKVDINSNNGTGSIVRTPLAEAMKWSQRSASHLRTATLLKERGGSSLADEKPPPPDDDSDDSNASSYSSSDSDSDADEEDTDET